MEKFKTSVDEIADFEVDGFNDKIMVMMMLLVNYNTFGIIDKSCFLCVYIYVGDRKRIDISQIHPPTVSCHVS